MPWAWDVADLSMDVADLFEDLRQQPVPRLAVGGYRRPRMAEEGVPENAERVSPCLRDHSSMCMLVPRGDRSG